MAQKKTPAKPKKTSSTKKSTSSTPSKTSPSLDLVDLTPGELKALPRPREGFEKHVAPLLALYQAEHDELGIKNLSTSEIETWARLSSGRRIWARARLITANASSRIARASAAVSGAGTSPASVPARIG